MLKAIHAQESREAADKKAKAIVDDLRASKMSKAADLVEQAVHETLEVQKSWHLPKSGVSEAFLLLSARH
jgi:hypothetical protein